MQKISVYDFDGTLYNGDCTIDFYKYTLKKYPYKLLVVPYHLVLGILWKFHFVSTKYFKTKFLSIINDDNLDYDVKSFWNLYQKKLFENTKISLKEDLSSGFEVFIISSSPDFLLNDIGFRLGVHKIIGTKFVDGKIIGENCRGEEKVFALKRFLGLKENLDIQISKMTSDSIADTPLFKISSESYIVGKDGSLKELKNLKKSK